MSHPFDHISHVRLSDSSMNTFRSCQRKFEFRKMLNHPANDESLPAQCGQCLHAAFQDYLIHGDIDRALYVMLETYPYHLNVMDSDNYSIYACQSALESLISAPQLIDHELAYLITPDGVKRAAIEVPFEFKIKNFSLSDTRLVTVSYVGKADQILYDRSEQQYIIGDTKTHRRNFIDMTSVYVFDDQLVPYGLVLERLLDHPVETFKVKYISVYLDLMKAQTRVYSFMKSKTDINDWAQGFVGDLYALKSAFNTAWFKRDHRSCNNFGRDCNYMDLCQSRNTEMIQRQIKSLLENEEVRPDHFGQPWVTMDLDLGFQEAA